MNIFKVLVTLTMFFIINYCDDDIEKMKNCVLKLTECGYSPDNAYFNLCYINQFSISITKYNNGKYDISDFKTYLKPVLPENYHIKNIVEDFFISSIRSEFDITDPEILLTPKEYCSTLNVENVNGCANSIKTNDYFTDNKYSNAVKTYKYKMKKLYNNNNKLVKDYIFNRKDEDVIVEFKFKDYIFNRKDEDIIVKVKPKETILILKPEDLNFNNKNEDLNFNNKNEDLNFNNKNEDLNFNNKNEDIIVKVKPKEIILILKPEDLNFNNKNEDINVKVKPREISHILKPEDEIVDVNAGDMIFNAGSEDINVNVKAENIVVNIKTEKFICNDEKEDKIVDVKAGDILVYVDHGEINVNVKSEDFNVNSDNEKNMWENTDVFTELQKKYYEFLSNMLNDYKEYIQILNSTEWCKKCSTLYNNGDRIQLLHWMNRIVQV